MFEIIEFDIVMNCMKEKSGQERNNVISNIFLLNTTRVNKSIRTIW